MGNNADTGSHGKKIQTVGKKNSEEELPLIWDLLILI